MFNIISRTITGNEIATVAEAKIYFRTEESGGIEDALIADLIEQAREEIERLTEVSLVDSEVQVYAENFKGYLPYSPVKLESGEPVIESTAEIVKKGKTLIYIEATDETVIDYETTAKVGKDLKDAVLELAFDWYKRGETEKEGIPPKVMKVIKSISLRNAW